MHADRRATAVAASLAGVLTYTDVHLTVIGVHVQTELMASDDVKQFGRVQDVQQLSEDAALRDAEQHMYTGQPTIIGDLLCAFRQKGEDPLKDDVR